MKVFFASPIEECFFLLIPHKSDAVGMFREKVSGSFRRSEQSVRSQKENQTWLMVARRSHRDVCVAIPGPMRLNRLGDGEAQPGRSCPRQDGVDECSKGQHGAEQSANGGFDRFLPVAFPRSEAGHPEHHGCTKEARCIDEVSVAEPGE